MWPQPAQPTPGTQADARAALSVLIIPCRGRQFCREALPSGSHERPGSRTPRPVDDAPGSASGKGRDIRHMSISGPNANTAVSPGPARWRPRAPAARARGKTAGGRAQRWARGRHRRAGRGARASRPDRPAQAGGQARPSRARCARRVQDRPARRHSVPGRAEQPKSVAGGLKGPGTLASMACSARSSSASRSRSPRWRRASACSGEVETGFPNRICAKSTNPGLTRKGRETRFAGGVERGRADRLRAISSHCTETQVCHNSHIVRERAGRYKLAPRARGFA
jgi:hypothetical protein